MAQQAKLLSAQEVKSHCPSGHRRSQTVADVCSAIDCLKAPRCDDTESRDLLQSDFRPEWSASMANCGIGEKSHSSFEHLRIAASTTDRSLLPFARARVQFHPPQQVKSTSPQQDKAESISGDKESQTRSCSVLQLTTVNNQSNKRILDRKLRLRQAHIQIRAHTSPTRPT